MDKAIHTYGFTWELEVPLSLALLIGFVVLGAVAITAILWFRSNRH